MLIVLIIENLLIVGNIVLVLLTWYKIFLISHLILLLMRLLAKYYTIFAYHLRRLIVCLLRKRIILWRVIRVLISIIISIHRIIIIIETIIIQLLLLWKRVSWVLSQWRISINVTFFRTVSFASSILLIFFDQVKNFRSHVILVV